MKLTFNKIFMLFFFFSVVVLFAEETIPKIDIQAGFNFWYIGFFAVGMLAHYVYKVYQTLGATNLFKNLLKNLFGWFVNKFHWTLIAGSATAVIGFAVQYGLPAEFATLNLIGIGISIVAGFIGDIANQGAITV